MQNQKVKEEEVVQENLPVPVEEQSANFHQVVQKSPKEQLEEYLADEENMKGLTLVAENISKKFNGNWFDFAQMLKKTPYKDTEQALAMLNMLRFAGLLIAMMRNKREMYKITLNKEARITLYKERIADIEFEKSQILKEIGKLEEK